MTINTEDAHFTVRLLTAEEMEDEILLSMADFDDNGDFIPLPDSNGYATV